MKCWSHVASSILHITGITPVPQLKVSGAVLERIIQYSHTSQRWRKIEELVRKAEHWLGFCCYQFLPVRAEATLQTLKFTLWLAADRNNPLVGSVTLTYVPMVSGHLGSVKILSLTLNFVSLHR